MHLTFLRSTVEQNRVRVMTKILQKKHSFYVLCLDAYMGESHAHLADLTYM